VTAVGATPLLVDSRPCVVNRLVWIVLIPVPPMFGPSIRKKFVPSAEPVIACGVTASPR
jgi:hypothetical protein